jgi:hypothetical protein
MTFQDPDSRHRLDDYIDQAGEGPGWAPIVLGIIFLGVLGFLIFGSPRQSDQPTTAQRSKIPNTAPSAPSVPTPAPPKPQ